MPSITDFRGVNFFLSNGCPCQVTLDGEKYPSVEHAFQAAKTVDSATRQEIRRQVFPSTAHRLGHASAMPVNWREIRQGIMLELLRAKFAKASLRRKLIATGDAELINGNKDGDQFWGAVLIDGRWVGENRLGTLLMLLRDEMHKAD